MQGKPPQEIYDMAYQIVIKNDIAECFSNTDYSPQTVKALMKSPNLLQEIYDEWLGRDYSHMDDLRQTIADFKDYMVKTEKILSGKERWFDWLRSNRPYVQIDPDVLERARQIDLLSYLRTYEPSNLVKVKGTTNVYCTAEHDSLKIYNGKWYWF